MDENSKIVYEWYREHSALASRMFDVFMGKRKHLLVAVVGRQGVGKTSYVYYALKTALIEWLCIAHGGGDNCLEAVEKAYGPICMNRYCNEPDGIYVRYGLAIYTGTQGLMNLINEVAELGRELAGGGSGSASVSLIAALHSSYALSSFVILTLTTSLMTHHPHQPT